MALQHRPVGARDVAGSVLESEEVARCLGVGCGRGGLAEAELRPADRDPAEADAGEVADGVHRDLGVVGTCLDAQVSSAACGVEIIAGELRQLDQRSGLRRSRPKRPAANSEGPKPTVRVRRDGWRPSASPVSSGGASGRPPKAPPPTASPRVIRAAAAVQSLRSWTSAALSSVVTSKAAKWSRSGTAVAIPAWCSPWKGTAAPASSVEAPSLRRASPPCHRRLPRPVRARHRPIRSATAVRGAPSRSDHRRHRDRATCPSFPLLRSRRPVTSTQRRRASTAARRAR